MWLNHPELIRNCPVGLLPPATQWYEQVRCGRTSPNSLEPTLYRPASPFITEVWCGRTTFETALKVCLPSG